ncbi:patatin-like phospholipase family protein [Micromonospora sp. NPDC023888]|uniref:patatin-like phospholipase family protein n=1 Tax=Micromonospora sp. NPDC023888 TaxID=3155607 RepID=UPI0033DB4FBB
MSKALVLGGGGIAGIAWITGLLHGLAEGGQDVTDVDLIVGTSAGATVAAQLGSKLALQELYARQVHGGRQATEIMGNVDLDNFGANLKAVFNGVTGFQETRRVLGQFAIEAETVPEAARREVIMSRLPSHEWPTGLTLKLVAVDAKSGDLQVFHNASGVNLVDAVHASCAVPGLWPPVTIGGRQYVDGAARSNTSADLAAGASQVLVIAPLGRMELFPCEKPLDTAIDELRNGGTEVLVVEPDTASLAAIGRNPADPSTRRPAAEAGRAQGRRLSNSQLA